MEDAPVFRVPKKRKVIQPRHDIENKDRPLEETETTDGDGHEEPTHVARARKQFRNARGGITFSTASRPTDASDESWALIQQETSSDKLRDLSNRFVGSTGQVVDVDKHMYVDSTNACQKPRNSNL
jgi:hypothetical protein